MSSNWFQHQCSAVVNFANSLLCGVIYAQLPRQVKVDTESLFNTSIQIDKMTHK